MILFMIVLSVISEGQFINQTAIISLLEVDAAVSKRNLFFLEYYSIELEYNIYIHIIKCQLLA
jgi:hypothetical protein